MEKYIEYLMENFLTPEEYIISKFLHHEVILLGEDHAVKNNLDLIIKLIPKLYAAGIYNLGMEFGANEDQSNLDKLINADTFSEVEATKLMFNYNVKWAYKEYTDIYKAAWKLNTSLAEGSKKFRIINLSYIYNWDNFSGMRTPLNSKIIFHKGNVENFRTNVIEKEILNKGEKILILTGTAHAYTKFKNPTFDFNGDDFYSLQGGWFGNRLYEKFGLKIFNIILHQPFLNINSLTPDTTKGIKTIEATMEYIKNTSVGFDLFNTVMGDIEDDSYNSIPYSNFTLKNMFDGYIFTKPIIELKGSTVNYNYLNDIDFKDVKRNWPDKDWVDIPKNETEYWKEVEGYVDLKKRYMLV